MEKYTLQMLPPKIEVESKEVLKQALKAHRFLAELKGISGTIPNQNILINTLPLLEAKDSSEIENIITTHDDLYKAGLFNDIFINPASKEVQNYSHALKLGFENIKTKGIFTTSQILEIQQHVVNNTAGFRKLPGTELKNDKTGETIYTPPQNHEDIIDLMSNIEKYINDDSISSVDDLIKMAIIHFQFESIHPFYDGNGRTGRIINILYLVLKGLLDIPVLYLSRYIIETKRDYYRLLQEVRIKNNWEDWIIYILKGIQQTSLQTIDIIKKIKSLMNDYKTKIRDIHKFKFYSQDLLNNLFCHPYTKIEFLERDLRIHRQTASKYLDELVENGFLEKEKIGKYNFYINRPLLEIFI
jgi:cell filamentation protein, protein adenylyltransferase